jgi:hypothetical protein
MFTATPATTSPAATTSTDATGSSSTTFADALASASSAQSALGGDGTGDGSDTSTASGANALINSAAVMSGASAAAPDSVPAALAGVTPTGLYATPTSGVTGTAGGGDPTMVNIAATQIGQAEQPDGSNNGPAISMYRTATAGAMAGEPWCAYFVSWVARQAGTPLGDQGQGFGAVSQIWSWAQEHGRAITNGPGVVPQPGDLIVFGSEHVGIVDKVLPNGDIQTIEGNYSNKVSQVVRSPTEATGYVRMG